MSDQPNSTPRVVAQEDFETMTMSPVEIRIFELGFAGYADGLSRVSPRDGERFSKWWLRGWDAGQEDNRCVNGG